MFAADEYLATWVSLYGKSLSEEDLEQILQYYKSSIGQKDVAASQVATQAFTAWAVQQSRERSSALLSQLMSELRAAKR
ncbi:MAG: hypothetical protein JWQ90_3478 [Hydrocarboniphaga sp.]|nr:hypothetical protein [Hydrocarboniphaga sp.]